MKQWLHLAALAGLLAGNVLYANAEEWKEVFADDFNRSDVLGPDWEVKSGKWDVRPGNLRANGPGAVIMCGRRFETPFRIEYECYSDNPCDLSVELRKKIEDKTICFVGFGAELNTLSKICVPDEGTIAVNKDKLIETGRKHRVIVEVGADGTVRQSIDGQETLKATVRALPKKLFFGFSVWNQGVFNSVKVFSPKEVGQEASPQKKAEGIAEKIPTVRWFQSFNTCAIGAITDTTMKVESDGKCSAKIADVPSWEYFYRHVRTNIYKAENRAPSIPDPKPETVTNHGAHFVTDPCVELRDEGGEAGKHASAVFPVPEMKKGFIEFDLMADHYAAGGLLIRLGDRAALGVDKDGNYYWQTGTKTIKLMDRVQMYHSVRGMARFYLQPQRWFTVRIDFDLEMSLANVAMVEMFNGVKEPQTEYLIVAEDLPLPTDAIKEIKFETSGGGRFYVDNIFMISRTDDLADDAKWHAPARQIMTAYYPLRKDPIHLKNWSMRHIRFMEGSGCPAGDELLSGDLWNKKLYGVILDCAEKYNRIMIRQAFLAEKMKGLERAWSYAEKTVSDYYGKVEAARQAAVKAEALLGELYEFYAACYLDRLNQDKMKEGFGPRYAALNAALETADTLIQKTLEEMRAEVLKRSGGKFTPYAIESEDTTSVKAEYSDGAFRRPDGKKDFLFVKTRYWLWPAMEKILMFSPIAPITGEMRMINGAKEPEYCDSSTNTWFYTCMSRRPDEKVALRIGYGMHNHESSLAEWWVEKHKGNSDIFLQNSKGEFTVSPQYNYWNPDVLAAQKATFEGLGSVVSQYGWQDRVAYLDLAQEAYFQITAKGGAGTWETGYNPTAIKTFRERLKKKYGEITVLNERWGSKYVSFEEIKPPEDWGQKPERVPGLTYEFELFRQESWHEWMKQCRAWLSGKLGRDVPSSCQITYNGETCVNGLDWVKLFETFNIVMEHYHQQFEQEPITYRCLENLREAFKSTTGIGEWYVSGLGDIFDEENIRNNGLRQAYQQVQWGRSVLVYWQAHDFMFLHNGNATENRLGHTVLRYHSAYIPISIARAEAHRAVYLECPLVQADVGLLSSESSFYNVGGGDAGLGVNVSSLLFRKSHDYGNIFERLIMDGRQNLKDYKVVIMSAACLPDSFVEKLLGWVQAGGVLITSGATGVMDEYGVKSGKFQNETLGIGQWSYEKGKMNVKDGSGARVLAQNSSKQPALIEKSVGQGKVYMGLNPVKENALYEIISRHAPRKFYGKDNRFHLAMRQGQKGTWYQQLLKRFGGGAGECLYLSILNPDVYQTLEDEIVLKGEYREITDISCNFPIVPLIKDGMTRFKVRLGPAEGIMIRIMK